MATHRKYPKVDRAVQLQLLIEWVMHYREQHPRNHGTYTDTGQKYIDTDIRNGIIFYSNGWGWRLRKNWFEELEKRKAEILQ